MDCRTESPTETKALLRKSHDKDEDGDRDRVKNKDKGGVKEGVPNED